MSKSKFQQEIIDHDQLFKQLLTTFFVEFLELFTPEFFAAIDPNSLEILPLEYFTDIDAGERKAMDVIIRVNLLGRPNAPVSSRVSVVVNCEHQSSSEPDSKEREEVMEITTSWKEEGIVEAERALTIGLLTKKVGNLSPELLARVSGLSIERVEALAEALLDFKHVGDLERWMAD